MTPTQRPVKRARANPRARARASDLADYNLMVKYIDAHNRRGTTPHPESLERYAELQRRVGARSREHRTRGVA